MKVEKSEGIKKFIVAVVVMAGLAGVVMLAPMLRGTSRSRTLVITARNQQFHLTGADDLKVGDRVTLIIRNDEQTETYHNFHLAGYGVRLDEPLDPGQSVTLSVQLTQAGQFTYRCPVHPTVMDGTLRILP